MDFIDACAVTPQAPGRYRAVIDETWRQGRTAYGGLAAAIGVGAVQHEVAQPERQLGSVDTSFISPLRLGDVDVAVTVLHAGRNVTHASADLLQDGVVRVRVHTVLALRRSSSLANAGPAGAAGRDRREGFELPYLAGVTPRFTEHMEMWWLEGPFPFTGTPATQLAGYCRHRTPARGPQAILGLLDAWPAPVLSGLAAPAPASTVRWTATLLDTEPPPDFAWFRYETLWAADGYALLRGALFDGDRLIATTEQLQAVFDKAVPNGA